MALTFLQQIGYLVLSVAGLFVGARLIAWIRLQYAIQRADKQIAEAQQRRSVQEKWAYARRMNEDLVCRERGRRWLSDSEGHGAMAVADRRRLG